MDSALLPLLDDDCTADPLRESAARLTRAEAMREFARAACERSRAVMLDDHDRRLRMRSWMLRSGPVPAPEP